MLFDLMYYDFPWEYRVRSRKGLSRSAENHYRTQPLDYLKRMPIPELGKRDSVHLAWVTYPNLREIFDIWDYWGVERGIAVEYKTIAFTWAKLNKNWHGNALKLAKKTPLGGLLETLMSPRPGSSFFIGNGYYTRANPELVVLGTTGKGLKRESKAVRNLIVSPFTRHSAKPEETSDRIESLFGSQIDKIEIFARRYRPGWVCLGNELDGLDVMESIPMVIDGTYPPEMIERGAGLPPQHLERIPDEYTTILA